MSTLENQPVILANETAMETPRPRKPFVDRFREDVADGFLISAALGSAYHLVNGGVQAVYENVPRLSCSMAVFLGVYGAADHAMVSWRGKEEAVLDCAVAMAVANGIVALPYGVLYAGSAALIGGVLGGVVTACLRLLPLEDWCRNRLAQVLQAGDPGGLPAYAVLPTPPV